MDRFKQRFKQIARSFGHSLAEFFAPRDWIPEIPVPRKPDSDAHGYQTLWEAIQGFPKEKR
jgi:hypothetical protein